MKEIVIKIPDEAKEAFDNAENNELKGGFYDHGGFIANAIRNGKVLPKGHGNLSEWITVNSPDDYPKESGDYLTVLRNTSFLNNEYTDITSFDCDGIFAEWDLKPQYKVVA